MTIKEVFAKAADILERDGWCQGRYVDRFGRRCMAGAILSAGTGYAGGDWTSKERKFADEFGWDLDWARWNDTKGRTQDEVIAKLRELAA